MDTSGLIAAVNDRSALHRETRAFLDELGAEPDARLVVSPFILAEVDYLISERDNRPDIALRVLRYESPKLTERPRSASVPCWPRTATQECNFTEPEVRPVCILRTSPVRDSANFAFTQF